MGRCHGCACAQRREKQQEAMNAISAILRDGARIAVDFALPPRCGGCGTIVAEMQRGGAIATRALMARFLAMEW